MNGELDFNQSLKARVSLLTGHDINELFSKVISVKTKQNKTNMNK